MHVRRDLVQQVRDAVPDCCMGETIGVHVRRGDYLALNNLYSTLGLDYYEDALSLFQSIDAVIVISDDIEWCKEHLRLDSKYRITFSPFSDDLLDFILMYLCKHHIIANSSFSWWAAYLRIIYGLPYNVFAPSVWYNMAGDFAHLNHDAFYPSLWTRVKNV